MGRIKEKIVNLCKYCKYEINVNYVFIVNTLLVFCIFVNTRSCFRPISLVTTEYLQYLRYLHTFFKNPNL